MCFGWADRGVMSFSGIHIGGHVFFFMLMNYTYHDNLGQIYVKIFCLASLGNTFYPFIPIIHGELPCIYIR